LDPNHNPQSPIPNPQSPIPIIKVIIILQKNILIIINIMKFNSYIFFLFNLFYNIQSIDLLNSKFVLNVKGNTHYLNFYYTTLFFGKERQNQTFLLDTTSSITTSPCTRCPSCGDHVNEYYTIKSNSSIIKSDSYACISLPSILNKSTDINFNENICNFYSNFEDRAKIKGFYTKNLISFEPVTSKINSEEDEEEYISNKSEFEIPLGCTLQETGEFQTRIADGVMGLNNDKKSFVSLMYDMKIIKRNLFSLCFDEYGGYFSLGEIDSKYHLNSTINYVDLKPKSNLYELDIKNIIVDNTVIKNKYTAIIDSSSTISYFPKDVFNLMITGFFSSCADLEGKCGDIVRSEGYGVCADFKKEKDLNYAIYFSWPSININFNNYSLVWKPINYYMNFTSRNKIRACLGFETDEKIKNIILGTNFMHGYDIIFDKENNKIGFVEAVCSRKNSEKINKINSKIKIEEERKNREKMEKEKNLKILEKIRKEEEEKRRKKNVDLKQDEIQNKNINNKTSISDKEDKLGFYWNRVYLLFFAIFIIFIAFILINYVNCNNNENSKEIKDHTLIQTDKIEEKDINNSKTFGQIIEMINESENK